MMGYESAAEEEDPENMDAPGMQSKTSYPRKIQRPQKITRCPGGCTDAYDPRTSETVSL
jgi:hypothetical protein